jgi:hypothetical protein
MKSRYVGSKYLHFMAPNSGEARGHNVGATLGYHVLIHWSRERRVLENPAGHELCCQQKPMPHEFL